jgi:hypothetical protein
MVERNEAEGDGSRSGSSGDRAKARETKSIRGGEGATLFSHTWEAAQATARTSTTVTTNRQGDAINAKHKGY